ncbi:DUF4258 domain-containing protein [Candidatus Pacearchaeota archaeon]|nr:DUF4258 domain-containing protein [Candidatus Pacearchaeota archaeon]
MEIVFTEHSKERMQIRKITEEEINEAIKYPEEVRKKEGKYYARKNIGRANIEVVYEKEKYIKIITIYYL